jgi:hypothetical protein
VIAVGDERTVAKFAHLGERKRQLDAEAKARAELNREDEETTPQS